MAYNKLSLKNRLLIKAKWEGGCLVWFGDKDSNGYGRLRHGGVKGYPAHKLMYELRHGPVADGVVIRHKCDNRACINIEHLEPGTQQDNIRDMIERGRSNQPKGEAHGMAKLTEDQVRAIRRRYVRGQRGSGAYVIAREFGVGVRTVQEIIERKKWKHVQ